MTLPVHVIVTLPLSRKQYWNLEVQSPFSCFLSQNPRSRTFSGPGRRLRQARHSSSALILQRSRRLRARGVDTRNANIPADAIADNNGLAATRAGDVEVLELDVLADGGGTACQSRYGITVLAR